MLPQGLTSYHNMRKLLFLNEKINFLKMLASLCIVDTLFLQANRSQNKGKSVALEIILA